MLSTPPKVARTNCVLSDKSQSLIGRFVLQSLREILSTDLTIGVLKDYVSRLLTIKNNVEFASALQEVLLRFAMAAQISEECEQNLVKAALLNSIKNRLQRIVVKQQQPDSGISILSPATAHAILAPIKKFVISILSGISPRPTFICELIEQIEAKRNLEDILNCLRLVQQPTCPISNAIITSTHYSAKNPVGIEFSRFITNLLVDLACEFPDEMELVT